MNKKIFNAISNRDSTALSAIANSGSSVHRDSVVNPTAEKLVDALFRQLKQVFPAASQTNLKSQADESAAKKQWIAAFAENGIRTKEQLSAGMRHARSSATPFWPSPGQFIGWCKHGEISKHGLPDAERLYGMVMKYCSDRGYYETPERYPWESNACWMMVPKLYALMKSLNLTESELRKRCEKELRDMEKLAESGVEFPSPVVQIPQLHIPLSNEKGLEKIAEVRRKLSMHGRTE